MIKKLIELFALLILAAGLVYLINQIGPLGAGAALAFKYIWIGILSIAALVIVAVTLIALAAIFVGIPFARSLFNGDGRFWSRRERSMRGDSGFIGDVVGGAINGALDGLDELKDMPGRLAVIEAGVYGWDFLNVKTVAGDIKLRGHAGKGVKAEIEIMEKINGDTEAFFEDGQIRLKTKSGNRSVIGNVTISLPAGLSGINAESVRGNITVSDFSGSGENVFKGVSGDIIIERVNNSAEISLKTVSGALKIKDSQLNSLITQSISGDVLITGSSVDKALFRTVSGDIDYSDSAVKNPSVKTVSGEVKG